jgi:adenine phosphoribosyltransferase
MLDSLVHPYAGGRIDQVAGIEARGFILGGAVAHQLSSGFVPSSPPPSPCRRWR